MYIIFQKVWKKYNALILENNTIYSNFKENKISSVAQHLFQYKPVTYWNLDLWNW